MIDTLTQEVADNMFLGPAQEFPEPDGLDIVERTDHETGNSPYFTSLVSNKRTLPSMLQAPTTNFEPSSNDPTHVLDGDRGAAPMVMSNEFSALQGNLGSFWLDAG